MEDLDQAIECLKSGDEVRNVAETKLNEASSRSHTVFRINISSTNKTGLLKQSQLNLVDLAGSEGASRTQTDGLRLREGSNINRSLLALSNVINKLSSGTKQFINFRDSKLTRILQTALGGNSSTAIICTITQTQACYQETVNTIGFGQKAKKVKTTVVVNEIQQTSEKEMERQIAELKRKVSDYETRIAQMGSADPDVEMTEGGTSITVVALQDQLKFLTSKLAGREKELSEKELII